MVGDHLSELQTMQVIIHHDETTTERARMTEYAVVGGQICEIVGTEDTKRCLGCIPIGRPEGDVYGGRRGTQRREFNQCAMECMDKYNAKRRSHACCKNVVPGREFCADHT